MPNNHRRRFQFGNVVVYAADLSAAKAALRRHQAKLTQGTTGISIAQDLTKQAREAQGALKAREIGRVLKVERFIAARKAAELERRRSTFSGRVGLYARQKVRAIPGTMLRARQAAAERAPAVKARARTEAKAFARGGLIVGKKVVKSRAAKGLWRWFITEGGTKSRKRVQR